MSYLTTKPIFDTTAIHRGEFIEVYDIAHPITTPKRGIITSVHEPRIEFIDGHGQTKHVYAEEIDDGRTKIKIADNLNQSNDVIGKRSEGFVGQIRTKLNTNENIPNQILIDLKSDLKPEHVQFDEVYVDDKKFVLAEKAKFYHDSPNEEDLT